MSGCGCGSTSLPGRAPAVQFRLSCATGRAANSAARWGAKPHGSARMKRAGLSGLPAHDRMPSLSASACFKVILAFVRSRTDQALPVLLTFFHHCTRYTGVGDRETDRVPPVAGSPSCESRFIPNPRPARSRRPARNAAPRCASPALIPAPPNIPTSINGRIGATLAGRA